MKWKWHVEVTLGPTRPRRQCKNFRGFAIEHVAFISIYMTQHNVEGVGYLFTVDIRAHFSCCNHYNETKQAYC